MTAAGVYFTGEQWERAVRVKRIEAELDAAVVAAMGRAAASEMRWGVDDCALWCADIIRSVLGYDPAAGFRGRYTTQRGARRVLDGRGLIGALEAAAREHGWRRIEPKGARVGDLGIIAAPAGAACVICRAPGWFVGRGEAGFAAVPAGAVRMAWSIG